MAETDSVQLLELFIVLDHVNCDCCEEHVFRCHPIKPSDCWWA